MKIEYLCHSCLYIDTGDTTLIMDPWFKGSCYMNQWHLFPKPADLSCVAQVKNILYSHGHEDHLHSESLKAMPCAARVFYPYQWRKGVVDLREASVPPVVVGLGVERELVIDVPI